MTVYCDCNGPPWPEMIRIHTGEVMARFYLCRRCGVIREDMTRRDGTIAATRWHELTSEALPAAVVEQARAILDHPEYRQLGLFGDGQ